MATASKTGHYKQGGCYIKIQAHSQTMNTVVAAASCTYSRTYWQI